MISSFWEPIFISLKITGVASVLAFILATLSAWFLYNRKMKGKTFIETVLLLPLVLPPSVVGFGLLVLLGRDSFIGQIFEWVLQGSLVFTWMAGVVAAMVVAFPLAYLTIKTGFMNVDRDLVDAARSMGAGSWATFSKVICPLSYRSLITGFILAFARSIGEFGATLMFAGNIPGKTQTIPTAIYIAVESGDMRLAYMWVITIVVFSFILLFFTRTFR